METSVSENVSFENDREENVEDDNDEEDLVEDHEFYSKVDNLETLGRGQEVTMQEIDLMYFQQEIIMFKVK